MNARARIRCDAAAFRKGLIEVLGNIHPGLVNVETWTMDMRVDIGAMSLNASDWQEDQIQRNTD